MNDPNFVLLYVDDPASSAEFYSGLLGRDPIEASPTFALFALKNGTMLGLWSRHTVEPAPNGGRPGSTELAFTAADDAAVDGQFESWSRLDMKMAQRPTQLDFGYSFVALDPDGHRLRVFAPAAEVAS